MQVILNWIVFFLVYFFLQFFLYRFFKLNINKPSYILLIICISIIVGFYFHSIEMLMNLIIINLMIISFYIIMLGIINKGNSLVIIDLISNKKLNQKKKLKSFFLKGPSAKSIERRLKINIESNFIKLHKKNFFINEKAKKIIFIYQAIKKIYRLKSDA